MEINKIYQGDCLELMKQIPDKSIDLVLTDPPYGINVGNFKRERERELRSALPQFHSVKVKVGIQGLSSPKVIGGLMIPNPLPKNFLRK